MKNIETQLPIGESKKLEDAKEVLPTLEVKNHVLWINPNFPEVPLSLKEGEPTNLARFFTPITEKIEEQPRVKFLGREFGKKIVKTELATHDMEVERLHCRSGILGRIIFRDKEGRLYRDIDLKGLGAVYEGEGNSGKFFVGKISQQENNKESWGVLDLAAAYYDKEISEIFLESGIRTHRVIAIIALEQIVDKNGEKLSIDEAREKRMISEYNKPAIQIRAFGTKIRFGDLTSTEKAKDELYIEDARKIVCSELGKDIDSFSKLEYLRWLAQVTAKNIGLMHKNRWYHGFLMSGYNLTLDGRLTDFDSITKIKAGEEKILAKDLENALCSFRTLIYCLDINEEERKNLVKIFLETYNEIIDN